MIKLVKKKFFTKNEILSPVVRNMSGEATYQILRFLSFSSSCYKMLNEKVKGQILEHVNSMLIFLMPYVKISLVKWRCCLSML